MALCLGLHRGNAVTLTGPSGQALGSIRLDLPERFGDHQIKVVFDLDCSISIERFGVEPWPDRRPR